MITNTHNVTAECPSSRRASGTVIMDTLARKLERQSLVKENIALYSHKTQSLQYCESRLEASGGLVKEFEREIGSYVTQPTSIYYQRDGKKYRYTPDALVKTVHGKYYFEEIKPIWLINTEKFQRKYSFLIKHFERVIGYPLVINSVPEASNDTIANYEILYFHLRQKMDGDCARKLLQHTPAQTSVDEMLSVATSMDIAEDVVWQLIARDQFSFNREVLLNRQSLLERKLNA